MESTARRAFYLTGVDLASFTYQGSGSSQSFFVCPTGDCPNLTVATGVVTPEPGLLPLTALGLAGLWFARRRKAIL